MTIPNRKKKEKWVQSISVTQIMVQINVKPTKFEVLFGGRGKRPDPPSP